MHEAGRLTVSVVSHGHGQWLPALLQALSDTGAGAIAEVVLTHNLPSPPVADAAPAEGWTFRLIEHHNTRPAGFAHNHNRAFERATGSHFCVLNPDIGLPDPQIWRRLLQTAHEPGVGLAYPELRNSDGSVQDHVRPLVTPLALWRRRVLRRRETGSDWVSGAFMVLPCDVYRSLGGFDEAYRLYCEDVDLCLRLQLAGWRLQRTEAHALHHAQRHSHKRLQHLLWHVVSLLRLWRSPALRAYVQWKRARGH